VLAAPEDAKADAARGQGLAEQWCSQCHGVRPSQANSEAPSFSAIAAEPSASQYALRTFLSVPHPTMPNFILKPDDIDDIVGYITSLKPQK
jgi:mono/diheme cytochrome c family protein